MLAKLWIYTDDKVVVQLAAAAVFYARVLRGVVHVRA
jgi:hypothetical protein